MSLLFWKTALTLFAIFQLTEGWRLVCYRGSLNNSKSVTYENAAELITSGYFNVTKKTEIYAHGYRGNLTTQGTNVIIEAFLKIYDRNVCAVDYANEANFGLVPFANFPVVVAAAYVVQQQLAEAMKILWQNGMNPEDVHMTGLSLGAHLVGNAAKTLSKLIGIAVARVTGLDPAKPSYDGAVSPNPRIDQTCAKFVDIIHTDTERYGMATNTGHIDFILNIITYKETGVQPGCDPVNLLVNPALSPKDACSHRRALDYYVESLIYQCQLIAAKAADEDKWASADFVPQETTCIGETTDQSLRGKFYCRTGDQSPYGLGQAGILAQ